MFLGHEWEWWLTDGAPGLGAIASLVLVIYYARLFRETREQTRATKASYAPSIDTRLDTDDEDILLTLINRGQGVAKNIVFGLEVTADEETCGYIADFQTTLQPGHVLRWNDEDDEEPVARLPPIVHNPKTENHDQTHLMEFLEEVDSAYFKVTLKYTDVLEDKEYSQTLLAMETAVDGKDSLDEIFRSQTWYMPWLTSPENVTLLGPSHIPMNERWEFVREKYKEKAGNLFPTLGGENSSLGKIYINLAYRARIEAESIEYLSTQTDAGSS